MAITINGTLAADLLDAIDATFNGGTLTVRSGVRAGAGNPAAGTALATLTFAADSFAPAVGPTKTANGLPLTDIAADATGVATHFRLVNVGGTRVIEGEVTEVGGGGDMEVSNTSVQAGNPFDIVSFTLTMQ